MKYNSILGHVSRYYGERIEIHGATPRGVDWNSSESQRLRFAQLLKLCDRDALFAINDYGCGYGAFADYLLDQGYSFRYYGFDISPQMIAKAMQLHDAMDQVTFVGEESDLTEADYTVASGIF